MFLNSAKIYVHHASSEIKPALLLYAKGLYFGITDHPSTKASFNHMNFSIRVLNSEAGASVSFCMIFKAFRISKKRLWGCCSSPRFYWPVLLGK